MPLLYGIYFLRNQCAKSLQLCPSLCNPMDHSLPGSPVHGYSPSKNTGVGCYFLLQGIFPTQGLNPHLSSFLQWQTSSSSLAQHGKPRTIVQFSSVTQSCLTLCDPMNHSMPGLPVHHQLPDFTQTHVHRVGDVFQPSHPLLSPFPPAPNPSQHQSLFQ